MWQASCLYEKISALSHLLQGVGLFGPDSRRDKGKLVGVEMSLSDPIADMLTRIRNAHMAGLDVAEMPHTGLKGEIMRVLKREGFITDYAVEGGVKKVLRVYLKYTADHEPVIRGLKRESKPGLRTYVAAGKLPRVFGGMGVAILSTSCGVMTAKEARKRHVGGEFLCSVW